MRRVTRVTSLLQRRARGESAARFTAAAQVADSKGTGLTATSSTGGTSAKTSSASKSRRPWLASLGVFGAAACIAAANLEEAPVTGRKQIMFGLCKPQADSNSRPLTPIWLTASQRSQVEDISYVPGLQLMHETSSVINTAISSLATSDPALQHQLSFTPGLMLSCMLSLSTGGWSSSMYDKSGVGLSSLGCSKVTTAGLTMNAGQVLQSQTPADFINAMSIQLAGHMANHEAEAHSCSLLAGATIACAATAAAWSAPLVVSMGLGFGAMILMDQLVTKPWVRWQQTYEADAIAAAISTTAGCQPDSILSFMQREHYAAVQKAEPNSLTPYLSNVTAVLQKIVPNSKLPTGELRDCRDLQRLQDAAAAELSSAPSRIQLAFEGHIDLIRTVLAERLVASRSPWQSTDDAKPCWLDRIAHMEKVLNTKATIPAGGDDSSPLKTCELGSGLHLQRIATMLQDAQDKWPFAITHQHGLPDDVAERWFKVIEDARSQPATKLAEIAKADAARHFDWQTYLEALQLELQYTPLKSRLPKYMYGWF